MEILTDTVLRAHWFKTHEKEYRIQKDTMITPAAKDFIKEHGITLIDACSGNHTGKSEGYAAMPVEPIPVSADEKPKYVNMATGAELSVKPENMTHLRGNCLVPKGHPQIAFRGMLDSLEAKIMEVQVIAHEEGAPLVVAALDEVLQYVRRILSAEVLDTPFGDFKLLGLSSSELRYESHHIKDIYGIPHPMPDYRMGRLCIALNALRTLAREAELYAVRAFCDEAVCSRPDVIESLNRLSSCIYILFCRQLTGKWPGCPSEGMNHALNTADTGKKAAAACVKDASETLPGFLVEASGRHVHLTKEAVNILFGKSSLTKKSDLSQPGQFAAKERVKLMTSKGELDNVAVLGPERSEVQVEMSLTDARLLGINIPVNLSGNLKGAGDVIIVGPNGIYNAVQSVIASRAHIHMTPEDAARYGVRDGDSVAVRLETVRPVTIEDVIIRVSKDYALAMHLDYDEANACSFKKGDLGYIIKK